MFASLNSLRKRVCQLRTMLSSFPTPAPEEQFVCDFRCCSERRHDKLPGKALRAFRAKGNNIAFRLKSYTTERGFDGK
jgi:hypothetical protein